MQPSGDWWIKKPSGPSGDPCPWRLGVNPAARSVVATLSRMPEAVPVGPSRLDVPAGRAGLTEPR